MLQEHRHDDRWMRYKRARNGNGAFYGSGCGVHVLVGVCGVVTNPVGHVLLIRTAKAGWELPGGRVEPGEELHQALRREVREETGCDLESIGGVVGVSHHVRSDTLLIVFRATSASDPVATDDADALEVAWFSPPRGLELVTHPSEHQHLADALAAPADAVYGAYF